MKILTQKVVFALATTLTLVMTTQNFAQANCIDLYEVKAIKRDRRHTAMLVAAAYGVGAIAVFTSGGVAALSITGFTAGLGIAPAWKHVIQNKFEDVVAVYDAQKSGKKTKDVGKFLNEVEKNLDRKLDAAEESKATLLFEEGMENDLFCPVSKEKKNGDVKYRLFTKREIAKWVAEQL